MCIIIFLRRVIYKILILVTSRLEKQRECDRGRVHGLKMHLGLISYYFLKIIYTHMTMHHLFKMIQVFNGA